MGLSLQPRHLGRYRDLIALLLRCGRTDLVRRARLEQVLGEDFPEASANAPATAEGLARDLERLGPTFVKLGQLLSTRADLLPDSYLDALSRLQDHVATVRFSDIDTTVRAELGVKLSKAFAEFDPSPLAAASLAPVHRAVLRDGRAVAVKVQRPGVRLQVADDLEVLQAVADVSSASPSCASSTTGSRRRTSPSSGATSPGFPGCSSPGPSRTTRPPAS